MIAEELAKAVSWVEQARMLVIIAGAGMSVDSGLPCFRDQQHFWESYPINSVQHCDFYTAVSSRLFIEQPKLAWSLYGYRLLRSSLAQPHPGHHILAQWGQRMRFGAVVFTSAVDGLFQKAGFSDSSICEHEGNIHALQCARACHYGVWSSDTYLEALVKRGADSSYGLAVCPVCSGPSRPNISLFGDGLWVNQKAQHSYQRLIKRINAASHAPLIIEVGTGLAYPTSRRLTQHMRQRYRATVIRINPNPATQASEAADLYLALSASQALQYMQRLLSVSLHERVAQAQQLLAQ